jgi:hypothetical protein
MGNIRLYGSTSGYTELAPPAIAPDGVLSLPTGVGTLATEKQSATNTVTTSQTTTSTSYTDLSTVGPSVTLTTGTKALIIFSAEMSNSTTSSSLVSAAVSGSTTIAASDVWALRFFAGGTEILKASQVHLFTGLTAGSNTFTLKYRVTGGTSTYLNRNIIAIDMGS